MGATFRKWMDTIKCIFPLLHQRKTSKNCQDRINFKTTNGNR